MRTLALSKLSPGYLLGVSRGALSASRIGLGSAPRLPLLAVARRKLCCWPYELSLQPAGGGAIVSAEWGPSHRVRILLTALGSCWMWREEGLPLMFSSRSLKAKLLEPQGVTTRSADHPFSGHTHTPSGRLSQALHQVPLGPCPSGSTAGQLCASFVLLQGGQSSETLTPLLALLSLVLPQYNWHVYIHTIIDTVRNCIYFVLYPKRCLIPEQFWYKWLGVRATSVGGHGVVTYHCPGILKPWLLFSGFSHLHTMWHGFRLLKLNSIEWVSLPCRLMFVFESSLWEWQTLFKNKTKQENFQSQIKKLMYWWFVKLHQHFHKIISIMAINTITHIFSISYG